MALRARGRRGVPAVTIIIIIISIYILINGIFSGNFDSSIVLMTI
jgi:hypothetical protein